MVDDLTEAGGKSKTELQPNGTSVTTIENGDNITFRTNSSGTPPGGEVPVANIDVNVQGAEVIEKIKFIPKPIQPPLK